MKKIIIIVFAILLTSIQILSQWSQIAVINTPQLNTIKFFNEYTGIAVGQGGIWRTTDSGFNWTQVLSNANIRSFAFYNLNEGAAVGDSGKVFRSTDGGINWLQLNSGTTNNLTSVSVTPPGGTDPLSTYYILAVGQNGIFIRSFNSGNTWSIGSAFTQDLYFINILPAYMGFTLGASTNEFYANTANGGTNWLAIFNSPSSGYHLYSGSFLPGNYTQICVGSGGRIRRTTNWGYTWSLPASNTTNNLYSVTFADTNNGWLCGQNGFIESTTNGGNNWSQQYSPNNNNLRFVTFINNQTGWIVGDNGVVLRTNNGGIVGMNIEEHDLPEEFSIFQNYPNPFNPVTKINYSVPRISKVTIVVYDILGRLVRSLVNDFKEAGNYTVSFDGSGLATGVYFFRIKAGDFVDSKKMVLVK